jgi:hypothetical protein
MFEVSRVRIDWRHVAGQMVTLEVTRSVSVVNASVDGVVLLEYLQTVRPSASLETRR